MHWGPHSSSLWKKNWSLANIKLWLRSVINNNFLIRLECPMQVELFALVKAFHSFLHLLHKTTMPCLVLMKMTKGNTGIYWEHYVQNSLLYFHLSVENSDSWDLRNASTVSHSAKMFDAAKHLKHHGQNVSLLPSLRILLLQLIHNYQMVMIWDERSHFI